MMKEQKTTGHYAVHPITESCQRFIDGGSIQDPDLLGHEVPVNRMLSENEVKIMIECYREIAEYASTAKPPIKRRIERVAREFRKILLSCGISDESLGEK